MKPFEGIFRDLRDRLPYYRSDWTDAWNYRVVPSTILTFFTNIFPAIAFAQDMFDKTGNSYGVNEVLLASALAGVVFGVFGGQPLTIVGVTGPISIFNYTVYEILVNKSNLTHSQYIPFMFWVAIWGAIFHFIAAIFNMVSALKYVTQYPCDIFGLFINVVYIQKAIQILCRQFRPEDNGAAGFASCTVAITMLVFGFAGNLFNQTRYFNKHVRQFVVDYSTPAAVVFFTGMIHFGGFFNNIDFQKLPITKSFHPTSRNNWIDVTNLPTKYIFIAIPFGFILTVLFYFDHSISSLMAQSVKYKLKKPAAFHYDLFLLGITTGISGMLGIPCPNGLIPQAPLHTESLLVYEHNEIVGTVEQRVTNTVQGLMLLGMMSRPLLVCLGLMPQCVLSGLFFIMGFTGLHGNVIVNRLRTCCSELPNVLKTLPRRKLYLFILFSLLGFAAEFAIVNTKGAIGFPIVLLFTVIVSFKFDYFFTVDELELLDGPVAHDNTIKNL